MVEPPGFPVLCRMAGRTVCRPLRGELSGVGVGVACLAVAPESGELHVPAGRTGELFVARGALREGVPAIQCETGDRMVVRGRLPTRSSMARRTTGRLHGRVELPLVDVGMTGRASQ